MKDTIARDVASAVAWLGHAQVQELARLLLAAEPKAAQARLEQWVPDLAESCDLEDPRWSDALLDELEFRLAPPETEDQDEIATRELPDYTRYAHPVGGAGAAPLDAGGG